MEYRRLPHGDEQISVIGLGTSSLGESDEAEIIGVIEQRCKTASTILIWQPAMRKHLKQ